LALTTPSFTVAPLIALCIRRFNLVYYNILYLITALFNIYSSLILIFVVLSANALPFILADGRRTHVMRCWERCAQPAQMISYVGHTGLKFIANKYGSLAIFSIFEM
jgi:hypothetical protein